MTVQIMKIVILKEVKIMSKKLSARKMQKKLHVKTIWQT